VIDGKLEPITMMQVPPVTALKPSAYVGTATFMPVSLQGIKVDYHYADFRFRGITEPDFPPISTLPLQDIPASRPMMLEPEEPLPEEAEDM